MVEGKKKITMVAKARKAVGKVARIVDSPVHNTSAAEMPNPADRRRPLRKDVRFAFRK
jgi:hypothetical protein